MRGRLQLSPSVALAALAPLCLALPLACHQRAYMVPAGDAGSNDASGSDAPTPLTLDISVTGCAVFDVTDPTNVVCSGPAPLTVSFAPVGSPALTSFLWTFGDGTPSSTERAPSHTYAAPGSYDVSVTGNGGPSIGQVSRVRPGLIDVQALATGAACDVDSQCADGLRCLCSPGSPSNLGPTCGAAFTRGLCSTTCSTGFCGPGAVCAATPLGAPAGGADAGDGDAGAPASPVCLADCSGGAACASGFFCQQIPGGGGGAAWVQGCLPLGARNDFGASCRDPEGALDSANCTTGLCADLGALGLCTAACDSTHPCPVGAACAHLGGTQELCLPACSATTPCTSDPSLACTSPASSDAAGDGGLAITAGDPGATYCAPR